MMKQLIKGVLFFMMLLAVEPLTAQVKTLSLDSAIGYALAYNENLKIADINISDAEAQVGQTRADGLPQINASFGYTNNVEIPVNIVPANVFDPSAPADQTVPIRFGVQHQGSFGVTATQMIWDGSFFIGLKAAKTLREKVVVDRQKARQDVIEQVQKAYYLVLVNQVRTDLIEANRTTLQNTLEETEALYLNGFAEKIDVSRLRVQLNNLDAEKAEVESAIETSKNLLKVAIGMPVNEEVLLSDRLDDFDFSYRLEDIQGYSVGERVELQQLNYLQQLAELDVKNVRSGYVPKVQLNAGWGRNTGNDVFGNLWNSNRQWFTNTSVGVSINIPVFDGLRKKYTIQRSKYQLETLNQQYQLTKNNLENELENAQRNLDVNLEKLEVQEANLALAQEVIDVTTAKFTEGVGSNLELVDAEQSYKVAEVNYLTALYNAIVAKIDLDKATGKFNP